MDVPTIPQLEGKEAKLVVLVLDSILISKGRL